MISIMLSTFVNWKFINQNCPPGFQVTSEFVLFDLVFKRLFFLSLALLFHLKCLSNSTSSRMRVVFLILSDSHVTLL